MLSKSRFMSGLACPKRLWWEVHEPDAPELRPDAEARWNFRQGQEVGRLARTAVPGARYEVTFKTDRLLARADIVEALPAGGSALIEVKGSNRKKDEHLWDIAFQIHTAGKAGASLTRAELMYLNRDARHPELDGLLIREDVTGEIAPMLAEVPARVAEFEAVLAGPLPGDLRGTQCRECPFYNRCWPRDPQHVSRFYRLETSTKLALEKGGQHRFTDLPDDYKLTAIQQRQRLAARTRGLVVEPGLASALEAWRGPLAFLDFETVSFAIPRFHGTGPWSKIPVQFSAHTEGGGHTAFLATDSADPRAQLAEALLDACPGTGAVVAYHASFERGCVQGLAEAVPELAEPLMQLHGRIVDLEPVVYNHVYHSDFRGSFSLKVVLPALVPDTSYAGLAITDGGMAQLELARLLYGDAPLAPAETARLRADLLAYCERDTWAMVALHERLRELAGHGGSA